jgi:hypothetical protein
MPVEFHLKLAITMPSGSLAKGSPTKGFARIWLPEI